MASQDCVYGVQILYQNMGVWRRPARLGASLGLACCIPGSALLQRDACSPHGWWCWAL